MKPVITYEDKIAPTFDEEYWSLDKEYTKLTIVEEVETGNLFISKKLVPIGTDLDNKEYWQIMGGRPYVPEPKDESIILEGYLIETPKGDYVRYIPNEYQLLSKHPEIPKENFIYKISSNYLLTNISTGFNFSVKWGTTDDWFFVSVYNVDGKIVLVYKNPNTPNTLRSIVQAIKDSSKLVDGNIYPINTTEDALKDYPILDSSPYFKLIPVYKKVIDRNL